MKCVIEMKISNMRTKKSQKLQMCSYWRLLAWESRGQLTRIKVSYVMNLGDIFDFPWLIISLKWGQKLQKLIVIDQVLTILGQGMQRWWLSFLDWLLQRVWVTVLLSFLVCSFVYAGSQCVVPIIS